MTSPTFESAIRAKAREYVDRAFMGTPQQGVFQFVTGTEIHSGPAHNDKVNYQRFIDLTKRTHKQSLDGWKAGDPTTCCNLFTGHYGNYLEVEWIPMGADKELPKIGKGIAWIPANSGVPPRFGDVFQQYWPGHAPNHMGISLDCDGGTWYTAEGGQGGLNKGYDFIKRKSTTQLDGQGIAGWVDIDIYSQCAKQKNAVPSWLVGLWNVSWQGKPYFYYFDRDRRVTYTDVLAQSTLLPSIFTDRGWFAVNNDTTVLVRWNDPANLERFDRLPATTDGREQMGGKAEGWDLTAVKITTMVFPGFS
jgi:hypothetical protein